MEEKQIHINNAVEAMAQKDDAIWSMDRDYRLSAYNASFAKRFREATEILPELGMDLRSIYDNAPFFSNCGPGCSKALERYATTSLHTFYKKGHARVHEFSFQPFTDGTGEVVGCCVWQKDITREMDNVHKLRESEIKYMEAQEITNVGHWNWDMKEDRLKWSEQLYRVFGQDPTKFKATFESLLDIIHPEDREAFASNVANSIRSKVPHDMVHRIIVGEGEVRYVHEKGRAYFDVHGNPYRMSGTTQDVTKEVLANHQILQQNTELQNFIRIISHNLRAPISNLLMLTKFYEWGTHSDNDDLVKKLEVTAQALDQTMKDLNFSLSLKRADREQFRNISLKEVIKDVEGLLSEDVHRTGSGIHVDFGSVEHIFGIKSYLVNILYNLILNAINYSREGVPPVVHLTAEHTDAGTSLRVADNGMGMELSPEKERKIFDMYGRLSGATEGKGLGLYLVKTQVEAMDGRIEVESEKGVGSTFSLHFAKRSPTDL